MESNKEDQNNEVLALSEICGHGEFHMYTKDELKRSKFVTKLSETEYDNNAGYVEIKLDFRESSICVRATNHEIVVRYLPPIMVEFILPVDYPSHQPPQFNVTAFWMSRKQIKMIEEKLLELWAENEGAVVLYIWYDFLKENLIPFLGISEILDLSETLLEPSEVSSSSIEQKSQQEVAKKCDIEPDLPLSTLPPNSTPKTDKQNSREYQVDSVHSGVVAKWNGSRGFGFISCNNNEYFFHVKNCDKDLRIFRGLEVSFNVVKSIKKPWTSDAVNVVSRRKLAAPPEKVSSECQENIVEPTKCEKLEDIIPNVAEPLEEESKNPDQQTKSDFKKIRTIPPLLKTLSEYSQEEEQRFFDLSFHLCKVCFSKKQGCESMAFPGCSHVYCKDCMKGYFVVLIETGQFGNLTCPESECSSQALPNQVKSLVSDKLFELYERQLLATTLESMTDILLCPRPGCQCPTLIDREASMGRCPSCKHTFCIYCKAAFHGIDPCRIRSELFDDYMNSDSNRKAHLEKIYGKKQLTALVNTFLSEKYISTETKPCPKCRAPIEKFAGCNKMTCNKCQTYFCYICGEKLTGINPYNHFRDISKGCFNKLFEGVDNDDVLVLDHDDGYDEIVDVEEDEEDLIRFYVID